MSVEEWYRFVMGYTPPMGPGGLVAERIVRVDGWSFVGNLRAIQYRRGEIKP